MIEIKSSLLNTKEFKKVKESLINVSEIDHKEKFRVKMIEYINDSSDTNNDIFFYDMLEFVRFLNPNDDAVAYTTPDHIIYMNASKGGGLNVGENVRQWDFIYDHECLHQLWETFAVADKIKKEFGHYNHEILNIASDCVINDYLDFYRKKDHPDGLVTPEFIKKEFGVEYDRKVDTQYTLYLKLNKVAEENQKMMDKMKDLSDKMDKQMGDVEPQSGGGQQGQSSQQGQSGQSGNSGNNNESAQDAADRAQKAADRAQKLLIKLKKKELKMLTKNKKQLIKLKKLLKKQKMLLIKLKKQKIMVIKKANLNQLKMLKMQQTKPSKQLMKHKMVKVIKVIKKEKKKLTKVIIVEKKEKKRIQMVKVVEHLMKEM